MFRPPGTRRSACAALVALVVLTVAACSGGSDDPADPSKPAAAPGQEGAPEVVVPQTWPLTGLPVADNGSADKRHPVIVLKMDNTAASAPQIGLGRADLVVEELVEGGLTRLAAFFYTKIPTGAVGPVRSMRASDIGIVTPAKATVVTSGAASVTIARIRDAGIRYFNEGAKGFFRDNDRSAPYNLFTNLRETATLTRGAAARPQDYLPFGDAGTLPEGRAATSLVARFGAGHSTDWVYRDKHYVNENSYAAEDDRFRPDTILALRVKIGDAGYTDPAGNPVPETELKGSGPAELFHHGRRIRCRWTKKSVSTPITLSKRGVPLVVPAGHTWIELVPQETGDVTFLPAP